MKSEGKLKRGKMMSNRVLKVGDRVRTIPSDFHGTIHEIPFLGKYWVTLDDSPPGLNAAFNEDELSLIEPEKAKRFNSGKVQLTYNPIRAQEAEARVWMMGAKKYGRNNWEKGLPFLSVLDSLLRHATAYQSGETLDPESGLPHMAHIRCNAAMLIEYQVTHPELDDRKKES